MNKIQKRRITLVCLSLVVLAVATGLILFALKKNINVFLTPSQLAESTMPANYHFRLGGLVKEKSVVHQSNQLDVTFTVTDLKHDVTVQYKGVLPDLFREGKGVIAEGELNTNGEFVADKVLAKHDENYMPNNVYKALRENQS